MAISVFPILDKVVTPGYTGAENILGTDLDFSKNTAIRSDLGTPADTMREIQVQFLSGSAGTLSVTFDGSSGTFFNLNNGETIVGLATLTIFVDNTTELNFRFSASTSIAITVGG